MEMLVFHSRRSKPTEANNDAHLLFNLSAPPTEEGAGAFYLLSAHIHTS